jgi:hypothetical protein
VRQLRRSHIPPERMRQALSPSFSGLFLVSKCAQFISTFRLDGHQSVQIERTHVHLTHLCIFSIEHALAQCSSRDFGFLPLLIFDRPLFFSPPSLWELTEFVFSLLLSNTQVSPGNTVRVTGPPSVRSLRSKKSRNTRSISATFAVNMRSSVKLSVFGGAVVATR